VEIDEIGQRALSAAASLAFFVACASRPGPEESRIKERDGHGLGGGAFQSQFDAAKHLAAAFSGSMGEWKADVDATHDGAAA
jgi:hypothetical protein